MPKTFTIIICTVLIVCYADVARGDAVQESIKKHVDNGVIAVACSAEQSLFNYGSGAYPPASVIKIATALVNLKEFGSNYRFTTDILLDEQDNLYVRGKGDPTLISEAWNNLGLELTNSGLLKSNLEQLIFDESLFQPWQPIHGTGSSDNPYDASGGALVTNFNTINVLVKPSGEVVSGEEQTPLTPTIKRLAKDLPPGVHRVNISHNQADSQSYTREVASYFLTSHGLRFAKVSQQGAAPQDLEPIFVYQSPYTLAIVIEGMLKYSNNFVANQLVMNLDVNSSTPPFNFERGMEVYRKLLYELIDFKTKPTIVEGSGISRRNSITAEAMLQILFAFKPYKNLLSPYRNLGLPAKTGTLLGVYNVAGYWNDVAFVIMLKQRRDTRIPIVKILRKAFPACP